MKVAWCVCAVALLAGGCGGAQHDEGDATAATPAATASSDQAIGSTAAASPPKVSGTPKENDILRLQVIEAGFFPAAPAPSPGRRYYTVGLSGTSRSASGQLLGASKGDDVTVDVRQFVFAQDERGCISRAEPGVAGVTNLFGGSMTFSPARPSEGRLVFMVPDDARKVRVLIAPAGSDGLAVPAGDDFTPSWPPPLHTIDDGTTMKILVLPSPAATARLAPPTAGNELVMLDVVVQNLSNEHGIEFQPTAQLRLMDAAGKFVVSSAATKQLGCRMDDNDVIPPGHARRVMALYELPAGTPRRLHYRGFERPEAVIEIR